MLLVIPLLLVAGCSSAPKAHLTQAEYVSTAHELVEEFSDRSATDVEQIGKDVCAVFALDPKRGDASSEAELVKSGLSQTNAGVFVVLSVDQYCPEYSHLLP